MPSMFPHIEDKKIASDMEEIFQRARAELKNRLLTDGKERGKAQLRHLLNFIDRMQVVTGDDFDRYASLIRMHVAVNGLPVHVLGNYGNVALLVEVAPKWNV